MKEEQIENGTGRETPFFVGKNGTKKFGSLQIRNNILMKSNSSFSCMAINILETLIS